MAWIKLVFISLFVLGLVVLGSGCQPGDQSVVSSAGPANQDKVGQASASERVEALDRALGKVTEKAAAVVAEDETYDQSRVHSGQKKKTKPSQPKRNVASAPAEKVTQASLKKENAKAAQADGERVYIVQIGAFRDKANAESLSEKLKDLGFPVMVRPQPNKKLGDLHLVRLEPTPNRVEAADMVKVLKQNGFESQIIER